MADRDALIRHLDELLDSPAFEDYGPNGLQVPGASDVETVVSGVSAHRELFERAAEHGAQMVLAHHGILWNAHPRAITPQLRARLEALFESDMSLAAYHLPLDAHAEVGNNALICAELGLERAEPFAAMRGRPIGWVGRGDGLAIGELVERCRSTFGQDPLVWDAGPETVRSVGVLSGGGAPALAEAVELGLDAFLTGEPAEYAMADAREAGIHFLACGHYATETFGVRRLGDLLAAEFGVEHRFVEIPNPV